MSSGKYKFDLSKLKRKRKVDNLIKSQEEALDKFLKASNLILALGLQYA